MDLVIVSERATKEKREALREVRKEAVKLFSKFFITNFPIDFISL